MNNSIFIAQLLGSLYILVGLGMFLSPSHYQKMLANFKESPSLLYLGGVLAFVVGCLICNFHWVWEPDWRSLITVIGCMAILKGILLLLIPTIFINFFNQHYISYARWIALFTGSFFAYFGFIS